MNTRHQLNESPKERLQRIARLSRQCRREVGGPIYPLVIMVFVLVLSIVALGAFGGMLGFDIIGEYTRHIIEWSLRSVP